MRRILEELSLMPHGTVKVHWDNKSAIIILNNPVHHDNKKHINMDWYFLEEKIVWGIINLTYVHLADQVADIFTQELPGPTFQKLTFNLGMDNIHTKFAEDCWEMPFSSSLTIPLSLLHLYPCIFK